MSVPTEREQALILRAEAAERAAATYKRDYLRIAEDCRRAEAATTAVALRELNAARVEKSELRESLDVFLAQCALLEPMLPGWRNGDPIIAAARAKIEELAAAVDRMLPDWLASAQRCCTKCYVIAQEYDNGMSVFKIGSIYHYDFVLDGRRYKASTHKTNEQSALKVERGVRQRIETCYEDSLRQEEREQARRPIATAATEFLAEYKAKHRAPTFAEYALGHVSRLLGEYLISEITPGVVRKYQTDRLGEKASPKSVNDEVGLLLRLCGDQGDLIRAKMKREKGLKLKVAPSPGKAFTADEKMRMVEEAQRRQERSPNIYPALLLALNAGLRDKELRELTWAQIDLIGKQTLVVGQSKTEAGTGRVIPLNGTLLDALTAHASWYLKKFKECRPEWYVFAYGRPRPTDPARPVTSFKTVWTAIRNETKVSGRWHDNRHTLVTELAESGAGDEVIMSIAGHVSRQMLSRYSHVRNEAKRKALEVVAARQRAAEDAARKQAKEQAEAAPAGATPAHVAQTLPIQ